MKTHLILNGQFYCQAPGMRLTTNKIEEVTCRRCLAAYTKGKPEIDYSEHNHEDGSDCIYDHDPDWPRSPSRTELRIEELLSDGVRR